MTGLVQRGGGVNHSRSRGVTLLELLVVLLLIGLVSAIVIPRVAGGPTEAELRSSTRQLAAGLRLARSTAVTERRPVVLEIDMEHRLFRLEHEPRSYSLPTGIELSLYTARQDIVTEKVGGIRFFPDGGSNGGRITVAAGEHQYRVDVDWLTGRVSISD